MCRGRGAPGAGKPGSCKAPYAAIVAPYAGGDAETHRPPVVTARRPATPRLAAIPHGYPAMPTSRALVASNDAPRLLRTLNHWRHKFEVRRDSDTHAHIPFAEAAGTDFEVEGDAC